MAKLVKACQVWTHTSQASVLPHPLLFDSGSRQGRTCKGAQEHRVIICHNSLLVQVQNNMGHPHESHDEMCLCHLSGAWHDKHNTYRWKFATTIAERLFPNAPPSKPSTVPSRRKNSRKNGLHIFFLFRFWESHRIHIAQLKHDKFCSKHWRSLSQSNQSKTIKRTELNMLWWQCPMAAFQIFQFARLNLSQIASVPACVHATAFPQTASCLFYAEGHSL